jgi:hypothetical protein
MNLDIITVSIQYLEPCSWFLVAFRVRHKFEAKTKQETIFNIVNLILSFMNIPIFNEIIATSGDYIQTHHCVQISSFINIEKEIYCLMGTFIDEDLFPNS